MVQLTTTPEQVALAQRNVQNSPLLQLPAELRNNIYALVLGGHICDVTTHNRSTPPRPVVFRSWRSYLPLSRHSSHHSPSATQLPARFLTLLLVCRQIYTEAALLPFTQTSFAATHYEGFEKWIAQTLLPVQRDAIASIRLPFEEVYYAYDERRQCGGYPFRSFNGFDGLKKLVLTGVRDTKMDEKLKKKIGRQFREKSGKGNLEVELEMELLEEVLPDRGLFSVRYWEMRVG